jgi:hypothetical protein
MYSMTFFQNFFKRVLQPLPDVGYGANLFSHYIDKVLHLIGNTQLFLWQKMRMRSCNYTCLIVLFVYVSSYNLEK